MMSCKIKLVGCRLKSADCSIGEGQDLAEGGSMALQISIQTSPVESGSDPEFSVTRIILTFDVTGYDTEGLTEEDRKVVFSSSYVMEGVFEVSAQEIKSYDTDDEFKRRMATRFANRLYPNFKTHIEQSIRFMGADSFSLPLHLEPEPEDHIH